MLFGSVCSGIEAASVAWHPLGWKAAWLAEIEKFPSAVLAHHYPDVPNLGDMTTIAERIASGEIEAPDAIVGGTPCQAFSVAGLRGGLSDARGQLTLSYVELANAIDAARSARGGQPAIIVWENVPGVLSSKDNAFGCFLGALAGEDCELKPAGKRWPNAGCVFGPQRTIAWRVLDAQYFGVAQRRRRVFVVASARNGFDPTAVLFEFEGVRRDTPPSRETGQGAAAGTLWGTDGGSDVDHARAGHIQAFGGNNTSGSIDVATARNACASASGRMDFETETFLVQSVSLRGREGGGTAELGDDAAGCLRAANGGGDKPHVLAFSAKDYGADVSVDLSPTLRAGGHTGSHANAGVMPAIAFNARQDPDSWTERTGPLDTHGSTQAVAIDFRNGKINGDTTHTMQAKSSGGYSLNYMPDIMQSMSVRRLTPRECERLQGFPDDYTLIPYGRPSKAKLDADWIKYLMRGNPKHLTRDDVTRLVADDPRYKALGNSMAVPCMAWIGQRIAAAVRALSEAP